MPVGPTVGRNGKDGRGDGGVIEGELICLPTALVLQGKPGLAGELAWELRRYWGTEWSCVHWLVALRCQVVGLRGGCTVLLGLQGAPKPPLGMLPVNYCSTVGGELQNVGVTGGGQGTDTCPWSRLVTDKTDALNPIGIPISAVPLVVSKLRRAHDLKCPRWVSGLGELTTHVDMVHGKALIVFLVEFCVHFPP